MTDFDDLHEYESIRSETGGRGYDNDLIAIFNMIQGRDTITLSDVKIGILSEDIRKHIKVLGNESTSVGSSSQEGDINGK